uniref:Ig-like domain-containing protein n=1 Tax=Gopherus agassizii TaxID=38772 RepID=A0A452IGT7_9SAUR
MPGSHSHPGLSLLPAGVHRFTHSQIISPRAAPGLPKRQSLLQVNGLALSAYDSSSRRMMPRNGYMQGDQETHQFWSISSVRCMFWDPWPTVHVSLVQGTPGRPRRLMCHVTGFYSHDIEVTWERGGQGALGEQMTSGILPNGDPTFQIRVSVKLGLGEHVCVVRHVSLGGIFVPLVLLVARLQSSK